MENIVITLILLILGYGVGSFLESRHYKSIRSREEELKSLPILMVKKPTPLEGVKEVKLVDGNVVISVDYFKRFVASLINIFGGRVSTYETLLDRARREAILRMKEEAKGASEIVNVRIETSSISKNANQNIGSIEIYAYGTAVYR
jgi:uncharacterized protein YbjQ (UPF0145 family)